LVDLMESHRDLASGVGLRKTSRGSRTSGGCNTSLFGSSWSLNSLASGTATSEELTLSRVDLTGLLCRGGVAFRLLESDVIMLNSIEKGGLTSNTIHEKRHHLGGVDRSTASGTSESRSLAGAELVCSDNGSV
jgi:hypothetical protein